MTLFIGLILFAGGFAACWYYKDKIIALSMGAEAFAKSVDAKAAALKAAL